MSASTKKILVFLLLTLALSSVFYYFIIAAGSLQAYSLGLMWSPGLAALLTQLIFHRSVRGLGWRVRPVKYSLVGYGLPFLYGLAVYGVVWLTGIGPIVPEMMAKQIATQYQVQVQSPYVCLGVYVLIVATIGMISSCVSALGEEIGWRGLLVPELAKHFSFTRVALVSGLIWAVWHYPVLLFAGYNNSGAPVWYSLACFTVMVIGISFAFAWLRLKSGSMWPAVILHASHNLFIQALFTPLTGTTKLTPYVVDEFGMGLALAAMLVAYLFWRKRGEIEGLSSSAVQ